MAATQPRHLGGQPDRLQALIQYLLGFRLGLLQLRPRQAFRDKAFFAQPVALTY